MKRGVSVIIPVYNAGLTIRQCLDSILAQKNVAFEIIVQEPGSSDNTFALLTLYKGQIRLFSENDLGVYDAMNKGIKKAQYDWLYFIGADDYLASDDVFEKMLSQNTGPEKILFGDVSYVNAKNAAIPFKHSSSFGTILFWKNALHHQAALYHKDCFESNLYQTEYKILADYAFNLDCLRNGISAKNCQLSVAVCGAEGISKSFRFAQYLQELRLKYRRVPFLFFLINIPWVLFKYAYKQVHRR
jgi:glycosyltransferase involved in cell wall biosynthesis